MLCYRTLIYLFGCSATDENTADQVIQEETPRIVSSSSIDEDSSASDVDDLNSGAIPSNVTSEPFAKSEDDSYKDATEQLSGMNFEGRQSPTFEDQIGDVVSAADRRDPIDADLPSTDVQVDEDGDQMPPLDDDEQ